MPCMPCVRPSRALPPPRAARAHPHPRLPPPLVQRYDDDDDDNAAGGGGGGSLAGADAEAGDDGAAAAGEDAAGDAAGGRHRLSASAAIVLHEDKKYYPDAEEVYAGAETLVQDEDTQPLSKPIIEPLKAKQFSALEKAPPATTYSADFLTTLMTSPALIRNVAVVGHLHHGKTTLCDVLIEHTHEAKWPASARTRYTDARRDEQERGVSIKATPVSLVLQTGGDKSYLVNVIDTPGHVNFSDEVTAAYRAADGVVLVVDAVEGVMMGTASLVKHAIVEGLPLVLVVAKVDRLITELKLPPTDAYFKLAHVIQEVNALIAAHTPGGGAGGNNNGSSAGGDGSSRGGAGDGGGDGGGGARGGLARQRELSPASGNVVFAGASQGWSFSLESFARVYAARSGAALDPTAFGARLWGDVYFNPASRKFQRSPPASGASRSFVQFVLEPLYKLYSRVLGEGAEELGATLRELRIPHRRSELHADPVPLLKVVLSRFLGAPTGFCDMVAAHVPSPAEGAAAKLRACYTRGGAALAGSAEGAAMLACDAAGPLMVNVVKLLSSPDGESFLALARVLSGTVTPGQVVRVLGEGYAVGDDEEDQALRSVTAVSVGQARYRLDVSSAPAGNLVLLEGVDDVITKTATLTDTSEGSADAAPFAPLAFATRAVVNVSVEPLHPSELPKVVAGLRKITKSYPLAVTRVEESGEHVLVGTGELALDCMLHDLRLMYAGVEVKVADPVTSFAETVVDSSSIKCFADTPNKRNRLTMIAEPLDKGLAELLEAGAVDLVAGAKATAAFFAGRYQWDALAARSVWAFGPSAARGPNLLLDDTLAGEVDKAALGSVRDSVVQGFQWACREGPLCDEPIRNIKFKLLDASIAGEPIHRGGGQVIPTARRVAYSSMLLATPRLMEPVYALEVLSPPDAVQAIYAVLARRRGHIVSDAPVPGTPFYVVKGFLPVIDSFGFETDLRIHTQGLAFGLQAFDHWAIVPGDPLDKSVVLRPLEPSPPPALAREFMVKTRRRKGLSEDVTVTKYFDEEVRVGCRLCGWRLCVRWSDGALTPSRPRSACRCCYGSRARRRRWSCEGGGADSESWRLASGQVTGPSDQRRRAKNTFLFYYYGNSLPSAPQRTAHHAALHAQPQGDPARAQARAAARGGPQDAAHPQGPHVERGRQRRHARRARDQGARGQGAVAQERHPAV